ncbi:monooxygenase, putative [Alloactinosynnema sp. L-07]|uniref:flavin-containing monooxygenase n=1 Tax=Alloactinosynnema sp. L-07 TaxID=1653480 RepID=UPI00065EF061|nr:NAD(P)/FAD-dependent oxidoreductase [Alloactinosynnema sp. L-07]CRK56626.1 monooxygenase, putative [Alloactinosynnema sp. L-07]
MPAEIDVLVVGAGQAGLAMGYELTQAGLDFLIVDGAAEVGQSWRRRWDSLRLFTPARYSSLPGLAFPAPATHLPDKDEVAAYLADYARHFALPLRLDAGVRELRRADGGRFEAVTDRGILTAKSVVVATGPFQTPAVPAFANQLPPEILQVHTAHYRNPDQLPDGPVLVVGAGNSGVQIAGELARTRTVTLAVGTRQPALPQRFLGRDLFSWLDRLGVMRVPAQSRLGRRMRERDPLIGTSLRDLERQGVRLTGRVTADGSRVDATTIVWATGYRPDYAWLTVPDSVGANGEPRHNAGVSPIPGLYYLGLPYQRTRGSALLGWVGHDATHLMDHLAARRSTAPTAS